MNNKEKRESFWKTLWPYLKSFKNEIIVGIIGSLIVGSFVAAQPFIIKFIVDEGISNDALLGNDKIIYVASMCAVYVLISAARVFGWQFVYKKIVKAVEGTLFNLRTKFFSHVQTIGMKFYQSTSSGELFNCILGSPIANIKAYLRQVFMSVPYQLVAFVISLSALIYYDFVLTAILLTTTIVMAVLNFFARRKMRRLSHEYIQSESEASKYVADTLNGVDAVEIYSIEESTRSNFEEKISAMYKKGIYTETSSSLESAKIEMARYFGVAIVYLVGAVSCVYRGVTTGVLFAFLTSMGEILTAIISWFSLILAKASAESGLAKITDVLKTDTTVPEKQTGIKNIEISKESNKAKNNPCVEFRDVAFAYDNIQIFKNLNCHINYGESVALVGSSGSGKSTFSKLLMRLYDVDDGSILVHGEDIRDYLIHDLRVGFGVVPQSPFIFYGSIWENIKIACPDATNKEIIQAMEIANVHEFVNKLERGWNTIVGDGGLDLSGGQKQRLAIARAVLGSPDVLIFDEATSALDNTSEKAIQRSMEELMKSHTVIIIAHRLSTIKNVDRILVFDDGKIVEEGTYSELEAKGGKFAELIKSAQ